MNKKWHKILYSSLLVFLLVSCDPTIDDPTDTSTSPTDITTDTSTTPDPERPTSGQEIVDFYAINDFHGAILEDPSYGEPGLSKVGSYLKEKKRANPEHTVLLSSGDMWQGTYEAYHSKGEVITEAMNDIGFDAMAIGNHEFDWGTQYIMENAQKANFPFLGANIMKFPEIGEKSEVGAEYAILQKGHLKIGVIGAIGQDQMTSISSRFIEDIYFTNPTPIIKLLGRKLKNEHHVDIVVLSIHASQNDIDYSIVNGKYVDAIFNAHSHWVEQQVVNGIPFIQGGDKGKYVSHIQFSFDYATNQIQTKKHENVDLRNLNISADPSVSNIVSQYKQASDIDGNVYVGEITSELNRYSTLVNLSNYAAAKKAEEQNYDIDFVFSNSARETIYPGTLKYRDLFKGLPFDNAIYIVNVLGSDLLSQANHSYVYRVKDYTQISRNKYYTIAVLDYLILHQNTSKQYNYYPNYNPDTDYIGIIKYSNGEPVYPRDLVKEIFDDAPNHRINPWNYSGDRYENLTI